MMLRTSNRICGNAAILDCHGRIVLGEETALLREQVKELLRQAPSVVLHLSNVSFIDSSGVGELVRLYASARLAEKTIVLAGLTGNVRDVLQITKLATVFATYSTAEQAAEALNARAARSSH